MDGLPRDGAATDLSREYHIILLSRERGITSKILAATLDWCSISERDDHTTNDLPPGKEQTDKAV